jgi:hypothetical protein
MNKKLVHYKKNMITIDTDIAKKYIELTNKIAKLSKELDVIEKELKIELKDIMEITNNDKITSNGIIATLKQSYIRNVLDTDRLKLEDLKTYTKYLKTTNVASSLSLKIEN